MKKTPQKPDRFAASRMYEKRGDLSQRTIQILTGAKTDRRNYEGKGKPRLRKGAIR